MERRNALVITSVIIVAILIGVAIANVLQSIRPVQQTGIITSVDIQVYSDAQCTTVLTEINWGTVESPSINTRTIYVKNIGNTPVTLDLMDDAPADYSVSWNQINTPLDADESVAAIITLSVPSGLPKGSTFNFDITIIGTQQIT